MFSAGPNQKSKSPAKGRRRKKDTKNSTEQIDVKFRNCSKTSNVRLPPKQGPNPAQTLTQFVSDDSQHFIFRSRRKSKHIFVSLQKIVIFLKLFIIIFYIVFNWPAIIKIKPPFVSTSCQILSFQLCQNYFVCCRDKFSSRYIIYDHMTPYAMLGDITKKIDFLRLRPFSTQSDQRTILYCLKV